MRCVSTASFLRQLPAEFQKIGAQTNKYLQIKDSIGADINDLVMPRYQFQIRELCFRIKTRLSQLIIRRPVNNNGASRPFNSATTSRGGWLHLN